MRTISLFFGLIIALAVCGVVEAQLIVAHRGASYDAPENTLAAFQLAWQQGADAIEGDFYLSKDMQIVCIHDKTTKRVAPHQGELTVANSTYDELRTLDVGSWKNQQFAAERIPTLAKVLATVPDGKQIFVEIKCGAEIVPHLQRELAASGLKPEQIVIICFDEEVVTQCRQRMPQYNANWLTSYKQATPLSSWKPTRDEVIATLRRTGATGLGTNGNLDVIDQPFVDAILAAGFEFHVWTVNDVKPARAFQSFGANSLTTDRPAFIRKAIQPAADNGQSPASIHAAVQKAIPLLQQGASVSAKERKCFTCHNQALPVFVMAEVATRGFEIDQEVFQRQLQHTWNHLNSGKSGYQNGKGQGGQVMTAGYAMWALEAGGWKADEVTTAVAHYLVEHQKERNRWVAGSKRLPSSGSGFTATYLALRALSHFGSDDQQSGIQTRREAAAKWLLETEPSDTEDRVFQLRSLPYIGADSAIIQKAVDALLAKQDSDGGWSQTDTMTPDAYATGTVLAALQEVGELQSDHPAIVSGCRYLIDSQLEDGTWHVATHAKPIQEYYESGFPHDQDQFISITATGWATLALARLLPKAS